MQFNYNLIWLLLVILVLIDKATGLECYVCTDQEHNREKCLNTIKTCEQDEDVCLSEIRWGSTPYWSQGAQKQYYVSKRCATKDACVKTRSKFMPFCTHIWYEDWKCSECCRGDRCNYYVILGGSIARSSLTVTILGIAAVLMVKNLLRV